jgi:hypothetical protein
VRTEMGGAAAPQTVEASVKGLRRLIDLAPDPLAARFQRFDGTPLSW